MELEVLVEFENDEDEIFLPKTAEDLDRLFESKINEINVDNKDWCVLAVDHNLTDRNTDKGGGYIKFYPHCKSVGKDMKDQIVYRVYVDDLEHPTFTVHNGMGKGTDYMPMKDREMLIAALSMDVYIDGERKMRAFDMFKKELKTGQNMKYTIYPKDSKAPKTPKISAKNIKEKVKGTDLENYLNIEYDGKRKL